jgi:hypothetical protein
MAAVANAAWWTKVRRVTEWFMASALSVRRPNGARKAPRMGEFV